MLFHTENDLTKFENLRLDCRLTKFQHLSRASALVPFLFFQKLYLFRNIPKMHSHLCECMFIFLCACYINPRRDVNT